MTKVFNHVVQDFTRRLVNDLPSNNTLRGAWAEQLVAHFLGITELPPNWSYFDMRDPAGRDISVKHSVGKAPKFSVKTSNWAWDPTLLARNPASEGWYRSLNEEAHYWCHAYVFAWLEHPTSEPDLDLVLDPDCWRFAVVSRGEMYSRFAVDGKPTQKSVGLATLGRETFHPGSQLRALIAAIPLLPDTEMIPVRSMIPWTDVSAGRRP